MKIAITGAAGLFGHGLMEVFANGHTVFALTRAEMDITRQEQVAATISKIVPEVVIHAAAIPDPDTCEAEPAQAYLVNVHGTRFVVEAARHIGARVAYISSDAVFDGEKRTPYTENDAPRPISVYGRTKLRAERVVLEAPNAWAFRVSVLFGPGKTNFVEKALRKIAVGETSTVAADQYANATYTLDAASKMREVIEAGRYGLYHLTNTAPCGRLELAQRAAEFAGLDPAKMLVKPLAEMGRRARRPQYAVMEMAALKQAGFSLPRSWSEALKEYVASLGSLRPASADQY
ncbi:MAG: SDR family oxidoreductase [Terriglobia bacterium]